MRTANKLGAVLIVAVLSFVFAIEEASAQLYSGQATAVKSTVITGIVPGITTAVSDTGPLPSAGGNINLASASANIAGVVTAGASTVTTSGGSGTSQSQASIETLDVNIAGFANDFRVRADTVASNTMCTCPTGACSGSSTITNLRIGTRGGGTVITVTGAPNQTVVVTVGTVTLTVVINEQIVSPSSITVNALHITLTDSLTNVTTDVVVSSSHSDIKCTLSTADERYSGRATGVRLAVNTLIPASHVTTIIADSGPLPTSGGNISTAIASANVPGVISTGALVSNTSGGLPGGNENTSQSNSTVNNLNASLIGAVTISATILQSNTLCQCNATSPQVTCSGTSSVLNLLVAVAGTNVPITITGAPNQVVVLPLGVGTITINEQFSAGPGDLTINALHVRLTPLGLASTDLVIAHSHSDIQCSLAPTAAPATVSGRVRDANGQPVAFARIQIMDQSGVTWTGMSGSLGEYIVEDIPIGGTYLVSATHKRYTFGTIVLSVEDHVAGVDFTAEQ